MENKDFDLTEEQLEILGFLWERKHSLDSLGISSKNIFDWAKQGLLLDPVKPKARRKYSIVEFVWLKLIVGLREFGLPLQSIRNLRETLLAVITFPEIFDAYLDPTNEKEFIAEFGEEKLNAIRSEIMEMKNGQSETEMQEFFDSIFSAEMRFMTTLISYLVLNAVDSRKEVNFFINAKGDCLIGASENDFQETEEKRFFIDPYIKYPLSNLLSEFLQQDDIVSHEEILQYKLLSKKELLLIDLLKKDNLVSLTVRLDQHQQIKLIETEENVRVDNARGKITDFIMRNNYQEIVCKTQDGKVTSLRRKTKYK